jgi:uncharacterized protein YjiS (DUF1127 family)
MRNYVVSEALSRQAYGRFTVLLRVIRNWRNRGDLKKLKAMDDYMLRDLGISREMVENLARLPLTADLDWEQERLRRR